MTELKNTPPYLVKEGQVVDYGLFRTPFRHLNIVEADITAKGLTISRWWNPFRLKQWQHIAFICPDFLLAFAIVDAHYMGTSFCYFVDRRTGEYHEHHREAPGRAARVARELWHDDCRFQRRRYFIEVQNRLENGRHRVQIDIAADRKKPGIQAEIELHENLERMQPLIAVLPINDLRRPLYTHKAPCPISGQVNLGGKQVMLDEQRDFALLDVQKTFYPFNTFWKWATCAGYDEQGRFIALNLVRNMIRDAERYNENCLWVDGRLTAWGAVEFEFEEKNILAPWRIRTTDGRCDLRFTPQGERADKINLGLIMSDYHQPYGLFRGTVIDDAGTRHELRDFFGVTEHHLARF